MNMKCRNDALLTHGKEGTIMDAMRLYFTLFHAITDAVRLLDAGAYARARQVLIRAQQQAEEQYIKEE